MVTIAFASLTGNTKKFVARLTGLRPEWQFIELKPDLQLDQPFHLLTYTTGLGDVPYGVSEFLKLNQAKLLGVSACGNLNWGPNFAIAADKIAEQYQVPILLKYELAGNQAVAEQFINKIEEFYGS